MEQSIIGAEEIKEFEEFKKSARIFKAKEKISSLIPDCAKKGLCFADIKSVAASAGKLNADVVRVNLSTAKTFKGFASDLNICCVAGGETSAESVIYEVKRAYKMKAREAEIYIPVFDIKNKRASAIRKILRVAAKKFRGRAFITTDFSYVTAEEYIFLCRLALKRGISSFFLPEDFNFAKDIKEALPSCGYIMRADSFTAFEEATSFGAQRIITDCAVQIAAEILAKAGNAE